MDPNSSTSNSKRDFRKLLRRIVVFCVLLFVLDRLVGRAAEYLFFKTRDGDTGGQINALLERQDEVLVFGDSRAESHYVPEILAERLGGGVFNAGMKGSNALAQYGLEQLIFSRYIPKLIIYDLSPYSIQKSKDPYGKLEPLYPYWRNPKIWDLIVQKGPLERVFFLSRVYPYNSKIHSIVLFNVMRKRPNASNGYDGQLEVMSNERIGPTQTREEEFDDTMMNYLEKFIVSAQAHGVKVVVAISPHYSLGPFAFPTRVRNMLAIPGIQTIDFEGPEYPEFEDYRLFHDTSHLNDTGARVFSALLGDDLRRALDRLP